MAFNVYAIVAYYFHPPYQDERVSADHRKIMNQFLFSNSDSDDLNEWNISKIKSSIFNTLNEKNLKPLVFWRFA